MCWSLQALINVDQLKRIHFFAIIIDLPILRSIITAILPGALTCPRLMQPWNGVPKLLRMH